MEPSNKRAPYLWENWQERRAMRDLHRLTEALTKAPEETLPTWATAKELAAITGKSTNAVDAKLRRLRQKLPCCFEPVGDEDNPPRRNEAKYRYRVADVIDDLRK